MFPEVQLGGSIQIDAPMLGPKQRTLSPAVTGGAILAVKVRSLSHLVKRTAWFVDPLLVF